MRPEALRQWTCVGWAPWDSVPSPPEMPPGLLRHRTPPFQGRRVQEAPTLGLGKQTRVRPAAWGSADSWVSETGHSCQAERQG